MTWSTYTTGTTGVSTGSFYVNFSMPAWSDEPYLQGSGPPECSSSTELSVLPVWIHDVNGYYRELGVKPTATRKELREAYQAKNGQSSARLTYILRQLLNPTIRFEYDCTPLGALFLDQYVWAMIRQYAKDRQAQQMQHLYRLGLAPLNEEQQDDLLQQIYAMMGVEVTKRPKHEIVDEEVDETPEDTPSETVDQPAVVGEDDPGPAKFEYSYYLWKTRPRADPLHHDRLVRWQRLLVSTLAREGVRIRFAVGLHGDDEHRVLLADVGYRQVFFLHHEHEPDQDAADVALRHLQRTIPSQ